VFTGIIEEVGRLGGIEPRPAGSRMRFSAGKVCGDLREGDSVSVNGVCLTAVDIQPEWFGADVSPETLRRSNLGDLRPGDMVNLERPLTPNARLGGHIVQGHVDGVGELLSLELLGGDNWWLRVRMPTELDRYLVFKGSVALDGISLTIAAVEDNEVSVTIIPHTYANTNLHRRRAGDRINVECDVLAKYVEKMFATIEAKPKLTVERLREQGY
jgi:riboflavin synthase